MPSLPIPMKANSYIITTTDGREFHCFVQPIGERLHRRWVFADASGKLHVGPLFEKQLTEAQVQALLAKWLDEKKDSKRH
jgi:hypothetical protein